MHLNIIFLEVANAKMSLKKTIMREYGRGRLKSEVLGCFLWRDEYFIEKNHRSVNLKKKSKAWNTQQLVPLLKTAVGREK